MNTSGGDFEPERDIHSIMVNRWNYGYAHELTSVWDPSLFGANAEQPHVKGRAVPQRRDRQQRLRRVRVHAQRDQRGVPGDRGSARLIRLDTFPYGYTIAVVARAATTADVFNAVAEPRRREILDVLAGGERPVNDLVGLLDLGQPQVSKHLRVLREVGAVDVRDEGRQRLYRLNGPALKPIHDWVSQYERAWSERFAELDAVLEELKQKEESDGSDGDASRG